MKKTKKERRIAILKDVLQQLRLERFKATNGTYVSLPNELRGKIIEDGEDLDAKAELLKCTGTCKVCAKGSIFLSQVRKENRVKLVDLDWDMEDEDNKGTRRVVNLFGGNNLNKIEATFEGWRYIYPDKDENGFTTYTADLSNFTWHDHNAIYNQKDQKIEDFINKYPNTTDRLVAIIKNCIKNNGIFKP